METSTRRERPTRPTTGTVLNAKYAVLDLIDQGGMGSVYEAVQRPIGRLVAVKVLHRELAQQAEALARFELEAKLIARLQHRNVVTLYDFGMSEDGVLFLVMERLSGHTLRRELELRGPLDVARSLRIIAQVASALSAAHRAGIVHRDLKPSNVQLVESDPDWVKVFDFGIAKALTAEVGDAQLTGRATLGTPRYMAPEQLRGEAVDARTDIYALGVLFFELLTGRPPFTDREYAPLMLKHLTEKPPRLREARPELDIDDALEHFIARALAKDPDHRFQSAAEVEALLEGWLATRTQRAWASDRTTEPVVVDPRRTVAYDASTRAEVEPHAEGSAEAETSSQVLLDGSLEVGTSSIETPTTAIESLQPATAPLRLRRRLPHPALVLAIVLPCICIGLAGAVLRGVLWARAADTNAPAPTVASAEPITSIGPPTSLPPEAIPSAPASAPASVPASATVIVEPAPSVPDAAPLSPTTRHAPNPAARGPSPQTSVPRATVLQTEILSGARGAVVASELVARAAEIGRCFDETQVGARAQRVLHLTVVDADGKQTLTARPADVASSRFVECLNARSLRLSEVASRTSAGDVSVVRADVGPRPARRKESR